MEGWDKVVKFLGDVTNDQKKQAQAVAAEKEQAEIEHATRIYEFNKEKVEAEFEQRKITIQQKIELLKQLEQQEYQTQMAAAGKQYQSAVTDHGGDSTEAATAQAKIQALADKYAIAMQKIQDQTQKSFTQPILSAIGSITGAMTSGFNSWVTGHEKFAKAAMQSWRSIEDAGLKAIEGQLTKYVTAHSVMAAVHAIFKSKEVAADASAAAASTVTAAASKAADTALAASQAVSNVGVAATGAAAGVASASGPAAPIAGPAAAVAMVASLAPFVAMAAAAGGYDLPSGGGPFPTLLHPKEMVLPAHLAENVRNVTSNSGNKQENHLHVTLGSGASPSNITNMIDQLNQSQRMGRIHFPAPSLA